MIEVLLTRGKVAIIDNVDSDLCDLKWSAHKPCGGENARWYAVRNSKRGPCGRESIKMHRVILERIVGRQLTHIEETDHINHDGLDNRRSNLRLATREENQRNARTRHNAKSSGYKGVTWAKNVRKWRARITVDGEQKDVGYFSIESEAAKAYDAAAKRIYQKFACLNFPEDEKRTGSGEDNLAGVFEEHTCAKCGTFRVKA
jgi:hypothetical protein